MKKFFQTVLLVLTLTGCSIIPKAVEFGQDKVRAFPVAKSTERETQRQAAQRAATKADETLRAAIATEAEVSVIVPATETTVLTEAVSTSLGPPAKPASATITSDELARQLDTAVAKLNLRVDEFKDDNNVNIGKKVEGTGFLQVPYFVYLGGIFALLFIVYVLFRVGSAALKAYSLSNPGVAVGLKGVRAGGALASKTVGQLVSGGEKFKEWIKTELPQVDAATKQKIEELFKDAHRQESDAEVKDVVKQLIK